MSAREAWAATREAAGLEDAFPGVSARQARIYGGYGVAARWQCGRSRERRVIGTAGDVRAALEEDFPPPAQAPAGEAVPAASPAGQAAREPEKVCALCHKALSQCRCLQAAGEGCHNPECPGSVDYEGDK